MKRRCSQAVGNLKVVRLTNYVAGHPNGSVVRLLAVEVFAAAVLAMAGPPPEVPTSSATPGPSDSEILADLRAQIKGRGKEPAETVYKDIQILKGRPAGAVLSIMEIAYNKSLGVKCDYCHDPKDWASDSKKQKGITRQMSAMVHDINEKYIRAIDGLKSEHPAVNCTTCHRGQEIPALDLDPAPTPKP